MKAGGPLRWSQLVRPSGEVRSSPFGTFLSTRCRAQLVAKAFADSTGGPSRYVPAGIGRSVYDPRGRTCSGLPRSDPPHPDCDDETGMRALKQPWEYEDMVYGHLVGGRRRTVYSEFRPHLVFLDVKMAGRDGLETLTRLRARDPKAQIVMISGHGPLPRPWKPPARRFRFMEKPLDTDRLLVTVRKPLAHSEVVDENTRSRRHPRAATRWGRQ